MNIPSWLEKIFRFAVFRLLENSFCKTPFLLVWSDHKFPDVYYKICPPNKNTFGKKIHPRHTLGGGHTMKASLKIRLKPKGTSWTCCKNLFSVKFAIMESFKLSCINFDKYFSYCIFPHKPVGLIVHLFYL